MIDKQKPSSDRGIRLEGNTLKRPWLSPVSLDRDNCSHAQLAQALQSRRLEKQRPKKLFSLLFSVTFGAAAGSIAGCTNVTTSQYEATALTTYTWQVKYANNLNSEPSPRLEEFATTSLLNRNGLKPSGAVTGPDDRGLWWPALPPRPTVDEVEQRQGSEQEASRPELLKSVKYKFIYSEGTLPTNYDVYREVVKAYPSRTPLELTLGVGDNSVQKAEPISN